MAKNERKCPIGGPPHFTPVFKQPTLEYTSAINRTTTAGRWMSLLKSDWPIAGMFVQKYR